MSVKEFYKKVQNCPVYNDDTPEYYLALFLRLLEEYEGESTSTLLGKLQAHMPRKLGKLVKQTREMCGI